MAAPVTNLIKKQYLHSNRWLFYQNLMYNGLPINETNGKKTIQLKEALANLKKIVNDARNMEIDFYNDFGVKDYKEWSEKFLIGKNNGNDTKIGKLTYIMHSRELYNILSTPDKQQQKERNEIIISAIQEAAKGKISNYMMSKLTKKTPQSLGEAFKTIGILNKTKNSKDIQQTIIKHILKDLSDDPDLIPKGAVIKPDSAKLKKIENQIKIDPTKDNRLLKSSNFIENEMRKSNMFNDKEISGVLSMWKDIFIRDSQGKDRRLTSFDINKVEGKVQEVEKQITMSQLFLNFDFNSLGLNDKEYNIAGFKTLVKVQGDELVERFKNKDGGRDRSESKIDTEWIGPTTKKRYYIQEKNSIGEFYTAFDMSGDPNDISKTIPAQIKVQSNIKLTSLLDHFKQAHIYPNDDIYDFITYCLINFEVLNKWAADEDNDDKADRNIQNKKLYKRDSNKNESKFVGSALTQRTIEQFLAGGLQIFISDIIDKEIPDENPIAFKSYNFIIYRGRYLIPVSKIIEQLIAYIETIDTSLFRLRFTSSLSGYNDSTMRDIYNTKIEKLKDDPDTTADYHNEQLVQYGSEQGNLAAEALKIGGIRLNFSQVNLQNLIYK